MKRPIIYSIVWIVASLSLSVAGVWLLDVYRIGGEMTPERAAKLGQGIGIVVALGLLPIWWGSYMRFLKRLEASRAKAKSKSSRKSAPRD
jgi:hypothetical protein